MNAYRTEIAERIYDLSEKDAGVLHARIDLDAGFIGFNGHFPGQPILPGVTTMQIALVIVSTHKKRKLMLREMKSSKFFSIVEPGATLDFICHCTPVDDELKVRVKVLQEETRIAELVLRLVDEERVPAR